MRLSRRQVFLIAIAIGMIISSSAMSEPKLNDLQILGTHNSFKKAIHPFGPTIIEAFCLWSDIGVIDYEHRPLVEQLQDFDVRNFELDVYADPNGGKYKDYGVLWRFGENGASNEPEMELPGFKVMHDPNADFLSTCHLLTSCLKQLHDWSLAHPNHLPIFVQIEVREGSAVADKIETKFQDDLGIIAPIEMTTALLGALDAEVLSVVPREKIVVPDDVRGSYATLREAVLANAWPEVADSRGKFVFIMNVSERIRSLYLENHPSLAGRVIFTYAPSDADDAAFVIMNDPVEGETEIGNLVAQGFIVRSRADSDGIEAYAGDTTRRDIALRSGAHIISTDYIEPDPKTGNDYVVSIPQGNPARCNPVRSGFCNATAIAE